MKPGMAWHPSGRRNRMPGRIAVPDEGGRRALVQGGALRLGPVQVDGASYLAATGQVGRVALPQQAGRPSRPAELRACGGTWRGFANGSVKAEGAGEVLGGARGVDADCVGHGPGVAVKTVRGLLERLDRNPLPAKGDGCRGVPLGRRQAVSIRWGVITLRQLANFT